MRPGLDHAFGDACDRLVLDLTAAYAVPALAELKRTYVHDRAARTIRIADEVRFTAPQTFSTPLVTYRNVFRRDDGTLYLYDGKTCVEIRIETEGGACGSTRKRSKIRGDLRRKRFGREFSQPSNARKSCSR
jgi:hypothetical protein